MIYWIEIFSDIKKTHIKVIPNKECIILTHNLLKLYIYFESKSDSSSEVFCKISAAEAEWIWFRFEIYSFSRLCVNIMHSLFGITFVLLLLKLSAGKGLSRGGAKPSKFPTKHSNFRHPPPPFALEKSVFSNLVPRVFLRTARGEGKTLVSAGHVSPRFWVIN